MRAGLAGLAAAARTAWLLALSCHPAPTVAVTAFATALAVVAGNPSATCALLAAAVLAGQLSIGWGNDRLDAGRDVRAERTDKPVAMGTLAKPVIDTATVLALTAAIGLSAALGPIAGPLNLATIACAWVYNLGVKATWFSWVPYALAFGTLPAVATAALPDPRVPGAWVLCAGATLGVAANLTNALPDLLGDLHTGIVGLPHRIGAQPSLGLAALMLLGATLAVVLGPPSAPRPLSWAALGVVVVVLALGLPGALRRPLSRVSFAGIIVVTGIDLLLIILTGGALR